MDQVSRRQGTCYINCFMFFIILLLLPKILNLSSDLYNKQNHHKFPQISMSQALMINYPMDYPQTRTPRNSSKCRAIVQRCKPGKKHSGRKQTIRLQPWFDNNYTRKGGRGVHPPDHNYETKLHQQHAVHLMKRLVEIMLLQSPRYLLHTPQQQNIPANMALAYLDKISELNGLSNCYSWH